MTQFSHSRVESYKQCAYKYKLRYIDKIKMLDNYDPSNALIIGTALHTGIEKDVKIAINWYYNQYPVITDEHVNEAMKLEKVISMMKEQLPSDGEFEVEIDDENFKGFIDYLVEVEPTVYDLYDFKYSNNVDRYLESDQLHVYKYYFEKNNPLKRIRNLYFMFAPKVQLKQKSKNKTNKFDENIQEFRRRFMNELEMKEVQVIKVNYNVNKVFEYLEGIKCCLEEKEFNKNEGKLCYFCEYRALCEEGKDYEIKESDDMTLPSTERRNITKENYKKIWIYGAPFSGKTTFTDKAPNPLNLNTDGNVKYVTMPVIHIRDEVRTEGRQTIVTKAWEIFKDTIMELSKNENDFKTIVVDLTEDTYEYCRLFMYEQLGITHESDDSFRAWDKVRTEFLSTYRKLLNLDYNIILISHEDATKDIMKKGGDKITAIKPNINEKVANKLAGMVDVVARVVADGDVRTLEFKSDEVVFGGGRLNLDKTSIPLDWDCLMEVYENQTGETQKLEKQTENVRTETTEIEPAKRKRKSRVVEELTEEDEETVEEIPIEETARKRRKRTE